MAKKKLVTVAQVNDAEATFVAFLTGKLTRMGASKAAAKFRGDGPLRKRQTKKWLQRFADDGGDVGDMASFMAWLLDHADEIISFISKLIILFAIALLLMCSVFVTPAAAFDVGDIPREPGTEHIEVAESTPLGKPIVAKVDLDEGERVIWKSDAGSTLIKADKCRAYIWATPGAHVVEAVLIPAGEADPFWLRAGYSVGDAPPTPPVVVKTLAEKAGDKAGVIAEAVSDLKSNLASFTTMTQVTKYLDLAFANSLIGIPVDHPAAVEIKDRLSAAASGTLTDASRKSLDVALAKVVTDLGAKPPVPPVTEGKRLVVIVADLKDTTPERASMFNNLRTGDEAKYLSSKGHQLLILDEAQETADGEPDPFVAKLKATGEALPAEFVLDLQTKAVIGKQALPSTSAAVLDFVKGNGG